MTAFQEISDALRRRYGHKFKASGQTNYDFSRDVYVGRAIALLLKADQAERLLRDALDALEYHQASTRPINRTEASIDAIRRWLTPNK